jgi:hypothetical protein
MNFAASIPPIAEKLSKKSRQKYSDYGKIIPSMTTSLNTIISNIIPDIAKDLIDIEKLKTNFCTILLGSKIMNLHLFNYEDECEILGSKLIEDIPPHPLKDLKIMAIDGSNVSSNFYGCDIALLQTMGVIYNFDTVGKLQISYYPKNGLENMKLFKILKNSSEQEITTQISLERAFMEVNLANQLIIESLKRKKNKSSFRQVDMIILDGSVLAESFNPVYSQNNSISTKYSNLFKEYNKLYTLCNREKITLVGVVKDTRSSTFVKMFKRRIPYIIRKNPILEDIMELNYRKLMNYFSDLDFFHRILQPGERSACFSLHSARNYENDYNLGGTTKTEPSNKEPFFKFECFAGYIKSVKYDFPVRFEFIAEKNERSEKILDNATKIASILLPISSKMEDFNLPIPQIEAHIRAKLTESDLKTVLKYLEREIAKEVSKSLNERIFLVNQLRNSENFDIFSMKNKFLIPKRRSRLPL